MSDRVAPVREVETHTWSHTGDWVESHPAYACLVINRSHGAPGPLFGSHLPDHPERLTFRLCEAQRTHGHGTDHVYSREVVTEFAMTYAQFMTLFSHVDRDGAPVTLTRRRSGPLTAVPGILWDVGADGTEAAESLKTAKVARDKVVSVAATARSGRPLRTAYLG